MLRNRISGLILILASLAIPIYQNYYNKHAKISNNEQVLTYLNETSESGILSKTTLKRTTETNYIAVLSIPEINLKRGLADPASEYNNIKYNIEIIKGSNMPNSEGTNLVLAAHNGNSEKSYFKDLAKLSPSSLIEVYYEGIKYIYELSTINSVQKTGEVSMTRDINRSTITLITCSADNDNEQVIYIGYLKEKIPY